MDLLNPQPSLEELIQEIKALPNLKDLEGVYLIGWEEGEHDLNLLFRNDMAYPKLNEFMIWISGQIGVDTYFYNITTANQNFWNNPNDSKYSHVKTVYFPTYLFHRTHFRLGPNDVKEPQEAAINENYNHNKTVAHADLLDMNTGLEPRDFEYTYLYMTLYPKAHRALMMDTLAKYDLHSSGALSWREFNRNLDRSTMPPGQLDSLHNIGHHPYTWKYWTPTRLYLDQPTDNPGPIRYDWLPKQFYSSFMQIIGESLPDAVLISEKTIVPLLFNKPFLIMGGQYSHKHLSSLGFKLYDEIFDYSFDSEKDKVQRAEGIAKNIINLNCLLKDHGGTAMLNKIKDKLIHNKKLAHDIILDDLPKEVIDIFSKHEHPYSKIPRGRNNLTVHDRFPFFEYTSQFHKKYLK